MVTPTRFLQRAAVTVAIVATTATASLVGAAGSTTAADVPVAPRLVAAAATGALGADDAIACPIPSGSEFIDSYGASRSGGRRHQGVDLIADRGTPVVAVQSGEVNFKHNSLGGKAAWLNTASGNSFYYAHFDAFEGESRFVVQGDVIGYVGSTGNAKGPHLHFEIHFGGSVVNPYDATFAACIQPIIDAYEAFEAAAAAEAAIHGEFKVTSRTTVVDDGDVVDSGDVVRR